MSTTQKQYNIYVMMTHCIGGFAVRSERNYHRTWLSWLPQMIPNPLRANQSYRLNKYQMNTYALIMK